MLTKEISPEARGEQLDHRFRGRDLPARALAFVSAAAKASGRTQLLSCALEIADVLTQIGDHVHVDFTLGQGTDY